MNRFFQLFLRLAIAFTLIFILIIPQLISAKAPEGSKIANILVEGKTEQEIYTDLTTHITNWLISDDFILTSEYERLTIPRDIFEFDIQGTINEFQQSTDRSIFSIFQKAKTVQMPLKVFIKQNHPDVEKLKSMDYIDGESVLENLIEVAEELSETVIPIVYHDPDQLPFELIAEYTKKIPEELSHATVSNIVRSFDKQTIEPMGTFSYLEMLDIPDSLTDSNEEFSFIATGLYETFLHGNITIIKRHHHQQVPDYSSAGLDVFIHQSKERDLFVRNDNDTAYHLNATVEKNKLHVAIYTLSQDFTYEYEIENEQKIPPRTVYRYSKDLKPGEEEVLQEGIDGIVVDVIQTMSDSAKGVLDSERISQDYYLPVPKIILVSTQDAEEETADAKTEDIDPDEIADEMDELEQNLTDLNDWLTGPSTNTGANTDNDERDNHSLRPFIYFLPAHLLEELNLSGQDTNEPGFYERLAALEQTLDAYEPMEDEEVSKRFNELEQQFNDLKDKFDQLLKVIEDQDSAKKEDDTE